MNVQVLKVTNVTPMLCVPTLRDLMSVDVLKVLREMVKPAQVKYDDFLYSRNVRPEKVHLIFGHTIFKQLLDEVLVISRIIEVEVEVISRSRRLRLITLTETLILHRI